LSESLSASTTLQYVSRVPVSSIAVIPVQKHLVLLRASNDVEHDVRLHLEDNNLVVVQDDVCRLLGRLLCFCRQIDSKVHKLHHTPNSPFSNAF
jgi:hypothetical protein